MRCTASMSTKLYVGCHYAVLAKRLRLLLQILDVVRKQTHSQWKVQYGRLMHVTVYSHKSGIFLIL